jgi:hypothetical protein
MHIEFGAIGVEEHERYIVGELVEAHGVPYGYRYIGDLEG